MGRRSEQRIAISISVLARGNDSKGKSYTVSVEASDISASGASLLWPLGVVPGAKIEVEYQGRKAWFQVRWIGNQGPGHKRRIGIECLEPSQCIWDIQPKQWEPDTYEPRNERFAGQGMLPMSLMPSSGPGGKERRLFPRRICAIEAQLTAEGYSVGIPVKIADISLGGCYIETFSPLPRNSLLELSLKLNESTLKISGKVRSSQMGFGMGIAFTSMSPEDFEKLKKFAPESANVPQAIKMASPPAAQPLDSLSNPEFQLGANSIAAEALVRVLCRKGLVTSAEVLEEMEKLKVHKV